MSFGFLCCSCALCFLVLSSPDGIRDASAALFVDCPSFRRCLLISVLCCQVSGALGADALQQHVCGFIIGILGNEFAGECVLQNCRAERLCVSKLLTCCSNCCIESRKSTLQLITNSIRLFIGWQRNWQLS